MVKIATYIQVQCVKYLVHRMDSFMIFFKITIPEIWGF